MGGINWTDHARCMVPADWMTDVSQCWYEWQSLLGGMLAVLAAGATIRVMRSQMEQAERHKQAELQVVREQMAQVEQQEKERRDARFVALRFTLPHYLSRICAYAKSTAIELNRVNAPKDLIDFNFSLANFTPPQFDDGLIVKLGETIEGMPKPELVALLGKISGEMQTLSSRMRQISDPHEMRGMAGVKSMAESYIQQSAKLYVMAESIIPYARGEDENVPVRLMWETIRTKLDFWGIDEDANAAMFARTNQKANDGLPFWSFPNDR